MPDQAEEFDFDNAFTDAAAQAPEPVAPVIPEAQPEATPNPLFEQAKAAGLQFGDDIKDEAGLAQFLLSKYQEQQPYVQYGQQYLAQQPANTPAQQPANHGNVQADQDAEQDAVEFDLDGHFTNLWKANELSPQSRWAIENGIVSLGPEGIYVPKAGFEQMALPILNEVNEAHIAQKQQLGKLFEGNPYKAIYEAVLPAIKHELTKEFQQLNQQSFQSYEQQGFVEKWKQDNASWLYQPGTQNLTPEGAKFAQTVQELQEQGLSDPKKLADYAMRIAGINPTKAAPPAQAPAQQAAPAAERPRGPDGKFLPVAAAPAVPPVAPPSKEESFLDKAKRRAAAGSNSQGYSESNPDHAVAANQGDLDSMFVNAYRQMAAA
jgi:hypothetical protein